MGTGMARLVEIFIEECVLRLYALRGGIRDSDTELVADICHSLKGSSANMGASTMAQLCDDLTATDDDPTNPGGTDILNR